MAVGDALDISMFYAHTTKQFAASFFHLTFLVFGKYIYMYILFKYIFICLYI